MIDFVQLCKDYGIEYRLINEGWVNIECPVCHHSGTRGFKGGLNVNGGYFNCWACGGHNLETVFSELLGIDYHEARSVLEPYSGHLSLSPKKKKTINATKIQLPMDELNYRCRKYLVERNYDPDVIQDKYGVVGSLIVGEWAGRLIIPIYYKSRLMSFQGRALLSKKRCDELSILRYKTLNIEKSVVDPKTILYNLDNCINDFGIVVEGPFDVWRFGDDCMATLGTSTTEEQLQLLAKRFKKLFIIFDPEKEAQQRAEKLAGGLAGFKIDVEVIDTQKKYDMGEYSENEIRELKKELRI